MLAIVAFGLLSLWQWHRAEQKQAEYASVQAGMSAEPAPASGLFDAAEWQHVTARGQFDPTTTRLVRNQPQDGRNGFWVVTLLRGAKPDLWVVRGWIPMEGTASSQQSLPEPPTGTVTVTGFAHSSEPGPLRAGSDLPPEQISTVAVPELDQVSGETTRDWFLLSADDPLLAHVPPPAPTDGRNLSYAGQWLLFALMVVAGWIYFLRREAREDRPDPTPAAQAPAATSIGGH